MHSNRVAVWEEVIVISYVGIFPLDQSIVAEYNIFWRSRSVEITL